MNLVTSHHCERQTLKCLLFEYQMNQIGSELHYIKQNVAALFLYLSGPFTETQIQSCET